MKIGFIGQGFVGKSIADDVASRGYSVVRYALEAEYRGNREALKECDIVFIAVPTPSTPEGFDYSIVEQNLSLVKDGGIVVVKSTLLPGTTKKLQDAFPHLVVLFSPEFLCEATAAYDAAHPIFNIIGISYDSAAHRKAAELVMRILPRSDHNFIIRAQAAELFKYTHNIHGYFRVVLSNMLYDTAQAIGADWADMKLIMDVDPMMSPYYNSPIHKSGRGAGGHCFIKDMAAFKQLYTELHRSDVTGVSLLQMMEKKNLELLSNTHKDQDLVHGVYGEKKQEKAQDTSLETVLAALQKRELQHVPQNTESPHDNDSDINSRSLQ
jgi:nucleotide sugar dehydrogenase